MSLTIATATLVVDDYDRGIAFYRDVLGLALVADTAMGGGKRWVAVSGVGGARLLIARADGEAQRAAIGNQTGGRVGFFLETDDFATDYARLLEAGVSFLEAPRHEAYGSVAVFRDPFGNKWDLIEPKPARGDKAMNTRTLGRTDLAIEPVIFGCNVLGWTLEENDAFRVLDAFVDQGLTAFDTADSYGKGKSETILGKWMKSRGNRDKVVVMTKIGSDMGQGKRDLSAKWIAEEVEHSLQRLQTDVIDLYQSHWPDADTPQEETLGAFDKLVKAGKVRWLGSSNQDTALLGEALDIARAKGFARYETIQNEFNLADRDGFGRVQQMCVENGISGIGYFSLARGFLSGKYRSAADADKSPRGANVVAKYINDRGLRILAALDDVSQRNNAKPAEVALAWIAAQPGVGAAIASGTTVEQVASLAKGARLKLSAADLKQLTDAGN